MSETTGAEDVTSGQADAARTTHLSLAQQDMLCLLGRCILRLQQVERLMKDLLALSHVKGLREELPDRILERKDAVAENTLGQLVKLCFETFFVREGTPPVPQPDDGYVPSSVYRVERWTVTMQEDELVRVQGWFQDLVTRRNLVVHHFIGKHDLWSEAGCAEGKAYLVDFYALLDKVHQVLLATARSMNELVKLEREVESGETFRALVEGRFDPSSPLVDWSLIGIVQALYQATIDLPSGEWMPFDEALARANAAGADESPQDYGCKSWSHLLHASRCFDLRYRHEADRRKVLLISPRRR